MLHIFLDVASYLGFSLQAVCHFFASLTSFHSNLLFCDIIFGDYVLEHLFISVPVCLDFLKSQSIYQVVPEKVVEAVLQACRSGNFDFANKEVNNFIAEGYPASQMLTQVFICLFLFYWASFVKISTVTYLSFVLLFVFPVI